MTKFEQIGVNYQYDAEDKQAANRAFQHSCNVCCNRGMRINCDRCSIAVVHNLVIATFDGKDNAYD